MANRSSFNLNLRLSSRGLSVRPYIKLGNGRGLFALLFGRRVKL